MIRRFSEAWMADLTMKRAEATQRSDNPIVRFFRRYGWGYAFVLPSLITFSVFTLIPVIWAFLISLQDYRLSGSRGWVGLENYRVAFTTQSHIFPVAIRNTMVYTIFTVATNMLVGLALASLIQPLNKWAQT